MGTNKDINMRICTYRSIGCTFFECGWWDENFWLDATQARQKPRL